MRVDDDGNMVLVEFTPEKESNAMPEGLQGLLNMLGKQFPGMGGMGIIGFKGGDNDD